LESLNLRYTRVGELKPQVYPGWEEYTHIIPGMGGIYPHYTRVRRGFGRFISPNSPCFEGFWEGFLTVILPVSRGLGRVYNCNSPCFEGFGR